MLPTLDRKRLAKCVGLLGSAHDGEALAAGRAADLLIRQAGLTWLDVIAPALRQPRRPGESESDQDAIEHALDFRHALTEWERSFCRSIAGQRYRLSPKQRSTLAGIVKKARRFEARAA